MSIIQIDSNKRLEDIDHHFKVSAGPGAGKTYWLVEHIRNVLHHSSRLGKIRKIACITYTNIAVETILTRLGTSATQVDVSTIHSFLYRHIVKPYVFLIADEYGLDYSKLDGHDELNHSYTKFSNWVTLTSQNFLLRDKENVIKALDAIQWQLKDNGEILLELPIVKAYLGRNAKIRKTSYIDYRKQHWLSGKIHHDDVLFFSYQLIEKHPFILEVIRAKFPYFFIDEFQDCNPIQVAIIKKIAESETVVGCIGDPAQSIYEFQGADVEQFLSFNLDGMCHYQILKNNRSTIKIVKILNLIRSDLIQEAARESEGENHCLIVGTTKEAIRIVREKCINEAFYTLSRDNFIAKALHNELDDSFNIDNLFESIIAVDSNKERRQLVCSSIKAIELTREKKFKEAFKELKKIFPESKYSISTSIEYLSTLIKEYDSYKTKNLINFIEVLQKLLNSSITKVSRGRVKEFYENTNYNQLSVCISIPDDMSLNKTIHKSKGDEFNNVLLVLESHKELNFILSPQLIDNEEHRIRYVAVSRAKERLFISVPSLEVSDEAKFSEHFEIIRC
ncbi:ATP-dependent helicase [Acinetobacter pittii]|uniref:UvrD-helicase domain-containing protein n=1 Tax=Acinetobacter pittii TaxID=48296 RepID=UPI0026F91E41|nr:ATP-dependent helicase [Acinetobacter pittii]MDO7528782.1 ATP-dependent helicase [Acinetobacter baumannii]MDO7535292.1 ATP-dependent helicase [Acinetobacter pittii]MDX7936295.1 ATP-dependent helicase [Acinetobacter baumannii]